MVIETETKDIPVAEISAQYNPKRFHHWSALHAGPKDEVLNMAYSPHVRFLKVIDSLGDPYSASEEEIKNTAYYKMHILYGKSPAWTASKIVKFIDNFVSIRLIGLQEYPTILVKPMHQNKFNSGYEIYEGHHRVAMYAYLGIETITAFVGRYEKA
jgi:hypothetical protein